MFSILGFLVVGVTWVVRLNLVQNCAYGKTRPSCIHFTIICYATGIACAMKYLVAYKQEDEIDHEVDNLVAAVYYCTRGTQKIRRVCQTKSERLSGHHQKLSAMQTCTSTAIKNIWNGNRRVSYPSAVVLDVWPVTEKRLGHYLAFRKHSMLSLSASMKVE